VNPGFMLTNYKSKLYFEFFQDKLCLNISKYDLIKIINLTLNFKISKLKNEINWQCTNFKAGK